METELKAHIKVMSEPRKIFDLMDTDTEPTDEQLAELMECVAQAVRIESAELRERDQTSSPNYCAA